MVSRTAVFAVVLLLGLPLAAQVLPQNGGAFGANTDANRGSNPYVILNGTVSVQGGGKAPQPVTVLIECDGQPALRSYTDVGGSFQFRLVTSGAGFDGPLDSSSVDGGSSPRMWQVCDLRAEAPGYLSTKRALSDIVGEFGVVSLGTIVLQPAQSGEGFMISAADAEVTKQARKDFQKGQEAAKKGRWDAAREKFQHAVSQCPRFVTAWVALGHVQTQENNWMGASEAYHAALQVDSRLPMAYVGLAEIAAQQSQWPDLADTTARLLALYPSQYPQFWFLNGVANFNMKHFDEAEKAVLRSIQFDTQHRLTRNQYLLGLVLAVKRDYRGAAEHLRAYLQVSPTDDSAGQARKQLADFERLAAVAAPAAAVAAGK
jgi:cytochrome c-type biogenesis protein CcmH/NrfG